MTITRRKAIALAGASLAALPLAAQETGTLHEIEIRKFRFNPPELEVRPGDRIRWTNADKAPHDAAARNRSWKIPILDKGQSAEITVTADSGGEYFCTVHAFMLGRLKVIST